MKPDNDFVMLFA